LSEPESGFKVFRTDPEAQNDTTEAGILETESPAVRAAKRCACVDNLSNRRRGADST